MLGMLRIQDTIPGAAQSLHSNTITITLYKIRKTALQFTMYSIEL